MKKIEAYINTIRVHWLVEELQKVGVADIKVTEYFRPTSQISLLELVCKKEIVTKVKKIIHKIGTTGIAVDHYIKVKDLEENDKMFLLNVQPMT